jgi:hypothetical protein
MTNPQDDDRVDMQALQKLVESNAKAIQSLANAAAADRADIQALANQAAAAREQARIDRELDRDAYERLREITESNSRAIQALANAAATDREETRRERASQREFIRDTSQDIRALGQLVRDLYNITGDHQRRIDNLQSG